MITYKNVSPETMVALHNALAADSILAVDRRQDGSVVDLFFKWQTSAGKIEHGFNLEYGHGGWFVGGNIVGDFQRIPEVSDAGFDFLKVFTEKELPNLLAEILKICPEYRAAPTRAEVLAPDTTIKISE